MKAYLLLLAALAPLGCSSSAADQSIFGIEVPRDDSGGGSSSPGTNTGSVDASICTVQGNASVSGTFGGTAFDAMDAIEVFDATKAKFTFRITDYANACGLGNGVHAGSNVVSIAYDANALASGTYDVTTTAGLSASYTRYDASCKPTQTANAASGTVKFERLDECGGKGSFDLVFGSNHVTASFTASVCPTSGGAATCQ